jgi:hypothetical protein
MNMTDNQEPRPDPKEYIHGTFIELRRLYKEGFKELIEDEVVYMTCKELHERGSEACLSSAKDYDAFVFGPLDDVISEHLKRGEDITDIAAEALVRRLVDGPGVVERATFDGWLKVFGFEPLTRRK